MRIQCPECCKRLELLDTVAGQEVVCPYCQARLKTSSLLSARKHEDEAVIPVVVVQPRRPIKYQEFEEDWEERRERREYLSEERLDRRERREFNAVGTVGFAFSVTTLVLILAGMAFKRESPVYYGAALCFSFPGAVTGLICSLIGCGGRRGASKGLAIAGAVIGGILVLIIIPFSWLLPDPFVGR